MGFEGIPEWLVLLVGITGIIGGLAMLVKWLTRTVKTTWQSNGRNGNGVDHAAPARTCPMDSGFVTAQLTNCESSREQAAVRDQQMLMLLQQILGELQAIRAHEHDILQGMTTLLERTQADGFHVRGTR